MGIRFPLQTVLDYDDTTNAGATSVVGGVAKPFTLPQDTENIVVQFTASVSGGVSATIQTTPDGGTTWFDVARTSIVSNTGASVVTGGPGINTEWLSVPVVSPGYRSQVIGQNSVAGVTNTAIALNTVGSAGASTLGSAQASGLPILSATNRIFLRYQAGTSAGTVARAKVMVNGQMSGR